LALDMTTGSIKWAKAAMSTDNWNVACIFGDISNCPQGAGPDFDFGAGPNLFSISDGNGGTRKVIGAGQKSGEYWLLDAATGSVLWTTQVGPGSSLGGIEWGTATDGQRIYVAISNLYGIPYAAGTAGSFAALDPATGAILWQTPDPNGRIDIGPVSVSNGVVFAGSMSGKMFAFDAATGANLWTYQGQGSSNAGAAIDDLGNVYWGNGYSHLGTALGSGSTTFYSFSVGGK
ncbi:MAG TPA: PQQ-binding-like beta-propeller repeat protein, partial [Deinococcales bacterium]|nr:PQQ-binding-like beta-propeller repeat protein [Deinococcales bacterium]